MKLIIIIGQSGTGKTNLANKLSKSFKDTITLSTDSYYRDNLSIKLLSIFRNDIYDRIISINQKRLIKDIQLINNKEENVELKQYDFKRKISYNYFRKICYKNENQFFIIEGIFAHRLKLDYKSSYNIICHQDKGICFERRQKRDINERGRTNNEVLKRFNRSWTLFYKNSKVFIKENNLLTLNPSDKKSYEELVVKLKSLNK